MTNMKRIRRFWFFGVLVGFILPSVIHAQTIDAADCTPKNFVVGFFNGVGNTHLDALTSMVALGDIIGTEFQGESVRYDKFYATADGTLGDILEAYLQRAGEVDQSGLLKERMDIFWDFLDSYLTPSYSPPTFDPSLRRALGLDRVSETVREGAFNRFVEAVVKPPTEADLARHRAQLDSWIEQKRKMLLVAHSQGNLFANEAYKYVKQKAPNAYVRVIHVAPASIERSGPYFLYDKDNVINGVRLLPGRVGTVENSNLAAGSNSEGDLWHGMVESYLNPRHSGYYQIKAKALEFLGEMKAAEDASRTDKAACRSRYVPPVPVVVAPVGRVWCKVVDECAQLQANLDESERSGQRNYCSVSNAGGRFEFGNGSTQIYVGTTFCTEPINNSVFNGVCQVRFEARSSC